MTRNLSFHSTFLSTYDHACQYKTAHVAVLLFYPVSVFISIMLCLFRIFSPLKDNPAYCLRNNRAGPWLSHYHTFDENCRGSVWFGQAILVTRGRIIFCSVRTCEGSCDAFGLIWTWGGQVTPKWFRFGLERLGFQMTWGGLIVLVRFVEVHLITVDTTLFLLTKMLAWSPKNKNKISWKIRFFSKSGNLLNKYYFCLQDIKPLISSIFRMQWYLFSVKQFYTVEQCKQFLQKRN